MPDDVRFSDQEIESIFRMARESRTFFTGLTAALLRPDSQMSYEDAQADAAVEQS